MRRVDPSPLFLRPSELPEFGSIVPVRVPGRIVAVCCLNDGGRPLLVYPGGTKSNPVWCETGSVIDLAPSAEMFGVSALDEFNATTIGFTEDPVPEFAGLTAEGKLVFQPPKKVARSLLPLRWHSKNGAAPIQITRRPGTFMLTLSSDPGGAAIILSPSADEAAKGSGAAHENWQLQPGMTLDWSGPLWAFDAADTLLEVLEHNIPLVGGA